MYLKFCETIIKSTNKILSLPLVKMIKGDKMNSEDRFCPCPWATQGTNVQWAIELNTENGNLGDFLSKTNKTKLSV